MFFLLSVLLLRAHTDRLTPPILIIQSKLKNYTKKLLFDV